MNTKDKLRKKSEESPDFIGYFEGEKIYKSDDKEVLIGLISYLTKMHNQLVEDNIREYKTFS